MRRRASASVRGLKAASVRLGQWLSREQAQRLLDRVPTDALKGLRDRAILAVLIGAGLRRSEAAALTMEHVQEREERWGIVDLRSKDKRVRSIQIAAWVKDAIDPRVDRAGIRAGRVFARWTSTGHSEVTA